MTKNEIADTVRLALCKHFEVSQIKDHLYLWDDLGADDLDFVELVFVLEEEFNNSQFDLFQYEAYRDCTVAHLIDHVALVLNPD